LAKAGEHILIGSREAAARTRNRKTLARTDWRAAQVEGLDNLLPQPLAMFAVLTVPFFRSGKRCSSN